MLKKWQLKDVILLAFLSIFFGGVFVGSGYVYNILSLLLTPLGLQAFANEILFGLWCMAAPIAAIFVPRVGSATIGEVLAALAEVLYGSQFGLGALLSGLVQGLGSEFGFIVTKNRYESWLSLTANSIGITLVSFVYEYIKLGYYAFSLPFVLSLLVVRFISSVPSWFVPLSNFIISLQLEEKHRWVWNYERFSPQSSLSRLILLFMCKPLPC
ncbi:cobalt ABC transporter permease [Streptococcus pneumoniae]|nr:cobalt ABC transporter permease [Streptococcus pneumoniae]